MHQKLRQVALTYLTCRWTWLLLPLTLGLMLCTALPSTSGQGSKPPFFPGVFGVGMPITVCMTWFVVIAKWQFVDPRARLMPGYTRPHLVVTSAIVATSLVLNPLSLAYFQNISPLGPLAFALMMAGPFLWSVHSSRTTFMIPTMAVFFSAIHPTTSQFWFAGNSNYLAIHAALAALGAALTAGWLWKLATLHEEDEGYFILPIGARGNMPRLERVFQGRLEGRKAARAGAAASISDHWHNRLITRPKNPNPTALAQYGWSRFPPNQQAVAAGLWLVAYGVVLRYLGLWFGKTDAFGPSDIFVYGATLALPGLLAALALRSRRVRMASELLRPASRTTYFKSLFKTLAKLAFVFWLAMFAGTLVVLINSQTMILQGDPAQLIAGYVLLSLAVQLPAFALALRMAQWRSSILFGVGCMILGYLEIGLLIGWATLQKTYGPIPTALLAAIMLVALSLPLQTWARNAWQQTELA